MIAGNMNPKSSGENYKKFCFYSAQTPHRSGVFAIAENIQLMLISWTLLLHI
jgi:hypothetical protein